MTFSELVLEARKVVHDARTNTGTLITSASEDGIRWSSASLQSICKGALAEMLRTFLSLGLSNLVNKSVQYRILPATISSGGAGYSKLTFSDGTPKMYRIVKIQELGNADAIYDFAEQEKFFSKRYRLAQGDEVDKVFTQFWDEDESKIIDAILPLVTEDVTVQVIIYIPLAEIYTLASTVELPFVDIDDLIYDYIQKEAYRKEFNLIGYKNVVEAISYKLQELTIELQRDNR